MILPKDYLMGRDKIYPINLNQALNMANLLSRVNHLIGSLKIETHLSSGYRPGHFNKAAGGSARSGHLTCEAIDLIDHDGSVGQMLKNNVKLLEEYGLYLENPEFTKTWVHLDIRERKNRIFNP
jgi:uncharacterized protein YcbK (DUF882 family)